MLLLILKQIKTHKINIKKENRIPPGTTTASGWLISIAATLPIANPYRN
jgi:hypothetical protein